MCWRIMLHGWHMKNQINVPGFRGLSFDFHDQGGVGDEQLQHAT
jgi:hypothetical protein